MNETQRPGTPGEDGAIVAAWIAEFRAACAAAAADPGNPVLITNMRHLTGAPADAVLRAQERLQTPTGPDLKLVSFHTKEESR